MSVTLTFIGVILKVCTDRQTFQMSAFDGKCFLHGKRNISSCYSSPWKGDQSPRKVEPHWGDLSIPYILTSSWIFHSLTFDLADWYISFIDFLTVMGSHLKIYIFLIKSGWTVIGMLRLPKQSSRILHRFFATAAATPSM